MSWMRKWPVMLYKKCTMSGITTTNPFNLWSYLDISDCLEPAGIIGEV